jgi:hypothetical protein
VPDPVGVCYVCNSLACSPHSGIDGTGKLICAFCAALRGITPKTFPLSGLPGGHRPPGGPGGRGPGAPSPGGPSGDDDDDGGTAVSLQLAEPDPLGGVASFTSLREALHFRPGLSGRGASFELPEDMRPERLIGDARRVWRDLYGSELTSASLNLKLAAAAAGLVLWAVGLPSGDQVPTGAADLPWLVRIPLLRAAVSQRVPA